MGIIAFDVLLVAVVGFSYILLGLLLLLFFFFLGRRRGIVRCHKVGVGLRQSQGALDGIGRMTAANLGKTFGADVVVLLVDDGRSRDGIAGMHLPLPGLFVEEGIVQCVPLGLEGLAVLGRLHVLEASGAAGRRGGGGGVIVVMVVVVVRLLHLVDVGDDILINSGGRGLVAVVQGRKLLVRHGRTGWDGKERCLGVETEGLHAGRRSSS